MASIKYPSPEHPLRKYPPRDFSKHPLVPLDQLEDIEAVPWNPMRTVDIAEGYKGGADLPPIRVYSQNGARILEDGNHRLWTARRMKVPAIRVEYLDRGARTPGKRKTADFMGLDQEAVQRWKEWGEAGNDTSLWDQELKERDMKKAEKQQVIPEWLGRPVLDEAHHGDLEQRAAIHEFQNKMPRSDAEQRAYDEYVDDHRQRAAAHHLDGMKAAEAVGNKEDAFKHWLLYDMHMKALGLDSVGPVPPEVQKHVEAEDKKHSYKFKAHKADLYALRDQGESQKDEEIAKSESGGRKCQWRLGERRCKKYGPHQGANGKYYCHHHKDHWANRIKQEEPKEEENLDAKGMTGVVKSELELELESVQALLKADLPLTPPPASIKPALHDNVPGFMAGLKAIQPGTPERGRFITAHMSHPPFLAALRSHPQGAQMHQQLMGFLNSPKNAGFRPGATKVVAKTELELELEAVQKLTKGDVVQGNFPQADPKRKKPRTGPKAEVYEHPGDDPAKQRDWQQVRAIRERAKRPKVTSTETLPPNGNAGHDLDVRAMRSDLALRGKIRQEMGAEAFAREYPEFAAKGPVVPLAPRIEEKKAVQRQEQKQKVDSTLEDVGSSMASDPGMQAAKRQREIEEKKALLKRGPQKFQRGHQVVMHPQSAHADSIPKNWKGTVIEHHDQYGTEWGDGSNGPHHMYTVHWREPNGARHEDYVHQDDLIGMNEISGKDHYGPGPTKKSELELELEAVQKLTKGDVIKFPADRVQPSQDRGEDASVVEHPVEGIRRDLEEHGVMATPKLVDRMLNDRKDVDTIGNSLLNAGHPPANVERAKQMVMEMRRKAALRGQPVDPRSKAPIKSTPVQRPEIPTIPPANPERVKPPANSKSGRFPDAKVIPIKPPEKK